MNSNPKAMTAVTAATCSNVRRDNLPELDEKRKNSPAGPRRLGATPISSALTGEPWKKRITLTGMMRSQQINPMYAKSRLGADSTFLSVSV